ncbi:hypothetical protein N9835_02605 [Alphaproteobacteria bacterium]|nr:hypothetical protein [Alphaproteobacteria bacterium]
MFVSKSVAANLNKVDLKSFSLNGILLNKSLALSKVSSCSIALFLTSKANKLSKTLCSVQLFVMFWSCSIALFSTSNKVEYNLLRLTFNC